MKSAYFPFTITLTAPALLKKLEGEPNSVFTMDYIPGSSIRGAVAQALKHVDDDLFRKIVLSGTVKYLNAYLMIDTRRSVPTPKSFYRDKHSRSELVVDSSSNNPFDTLNVLVRSGSNYITLTAPDLYEDQPSKARRIHHQRDRSRGRSFEKDASSDANIFVYEYLRPWQTFCGMLSISGLDDGAITEIADTMKTALGGFMLIGRSKRAGYGGAASVDWLEPVQREILATGSRHVVKELKYGTLFRALLLSDYVGRNPITGQDDPSSFTGEIASALQDSAELVKIIGTTHYVGGFNRKWGLELPQRLCMSAGSLALFRAKKDLTESALRKLEDEGLGERTIDGFGRVVFLEAPAKSIKVGTLRRAISKPVGTAPKLVIQIQKSILLDELEKQCSLTGRMMVRNVQGECSRNLLSRLLIPFRSGHEQGLNRLKDWLGAGQESMMLRSTAMKQLEQCTFKMGGGPRRSLKDVLLDLVSDHNGDKTSSWDVLKEVRVDMLMERCLIGSIEDAQQIVSSSKKRLSAWVIEAMLTSLIHRTGGD